MKNWTSEHRKEVKWWFFVGNYAIEEKFIEIKKKLLFAQLGENNNVSVKKECNLPMKV